jgi:hypothetical protein
VLRAGAERLGALSSHLEREGRASEAHGLAMALVVLAQIDRELQAELVAAAEGQS